MVLLYVTLLHSVKGSGSSTPVLFILAIDPIQKLIEKALGKATEFNIIKPFDSRPTTLRASLYADDAAIFFNPGSIELHALQALLDSFGVVSGLTTSIDKSEVATDRDTTPYKQDWSLFAGGGKGDSFPRLDA